MTGRRIQEHGQGKNPESELEKVRDRASQLDSTWCIRENFWKCHEDIAYDNVSVNEWRGDLVRSRLFFGQFKAEQRCDDTYALTRATFFMRSLINRASPDMDWSTSVRHPRLFMHAGTKKRIFVRPPKRCENKYWRLKVPIHGTRKASQQL